MKIEKVLIKDETGYQKGKSLITSNSAEHGISTSVE
jgi:hypothetical protein